MYMKHIHQFYYSESKLVFFCNFPEGSHTGGSGSTPQGSSTMNQSKLEMK